MLDRFIHTLRQGLRAVRSAPGLSAIVVTTLAVALAAAVTAFSVLNATVLRKLPFTDPDRVVVISHSYADSGGACSPPLFLDYRRASRTFQSLSAAMPWTPNLTGRGEPERVVGLLVSADFFETLGISAARGRTFTPDEEQPGREHAVVVSDGFWRRRFGAEASLLGSTLQLNGETYQVVGIMPQGFTWGRVYGRESEAEVWAPFALTPARVAEDSRGIEYLDVYGRLKPDVTLAQSSADLLAIVSGLRARFPGYYREASGFRVTPVSLQQEIVQQTKPVLMLVFVAVMALLLVATTNVAGLLLTRATGRRREISVRHALGASRVRLTAQCVGEASVLAAAAGCLGLVLTSVAVGIIDRVDRAALPRTRAIEIDGAVLTFGLLATLGVAALIGLVPAWQITRSDLMGWLRTASLSSGGRSGVRARRLLVAIQTGIALTLLAGSGLLVRSISRLEGVPLGFQTDAVLTATVQLPRARYELATTRVQFLDDVLARLAPRPGILAAGAISELPMSNVVNSSSFEIEGRVVRPSEKRPHAETWSASPGYFSALRVALKHGRLFDDSDRASKTQVAVVSQSTVDRYFSGIEPLGQRIDFEGRGPDRHRWREIVGVVADVHDRRIDRAPGPQIYVPYAQRPAGGMFLVLRTSGAPLNTVADLRAAVKEVDPDLPVYGVLTMENLAARTTTDRRVVRTALVGFATAAVVLVALGLYGLLAQVVRERVPEIGLRIALGARPVDVIRVFLAESGRLVIQGLALGLLAALAATRLLQGFMFGISTLDPLTYVTAAALLTAVAAAACAGPAWRAAHLDPLVALRRE